MATRLYLPASGSPPLGSLAVNSNWELTNGLVRLPSFTTKQNTALTTSQRTWPATSTQQWCWYQFQSDILKYAYNWLATDTVSMVVGKCAQTTTSGDSHLAYVVRVVSGDGATVRGVIGLYHATSSEFPLMASAATRIHSARVNGAAAFSSQAGDRIIIEIGLHGVTPAAELIQMRIGDPTPPPDDFALTAGLTTDLCPWVQLSRDIEFGTPPEEHSGSAVISGNGTLSGAVSKGGKGSALASGGGILAALALVGMFGSGIVSGNGSQVAVGQKAAISAPSISGGGSLTAIGEKSESEQHSGMAGLSGGGAVLSVGSKGGSGPSAISGNGIFEATGGKRAAASPTISGAGALTGSGVKGGQASADISASGELDAKGRKDASGLAILSGAGGQIGTGKKQSLGAAFASGGGALTATGIKIEKEEHFGAALISGKGGILASGEKAAFSASSVSGGGELVASGEAAGPEIYLPGRVIWPVVLTRRTGLMNVEGRQKIFNVRNRGVPK